MNEFFNHAPCIYFSSADDGTLFEVNDRLCSLLQYELTELIGKRSDILFTIPTRIFQQTHFFPLLKMQGHAEEIFISLQTKDGRELPVLINAERKLINDTAVNLFVGIVVYNRKKFEEELIAARKTAENALKENTALNQAKEELQRHSEELDRRILVINKQNEELRQFNRVVTHDMEEPLRKLSLFSGMLRENRSSDEVLKIVSKITRVSHHMHSILTGLQQYVWLTGAPVNPVKIELAELLLPIQHTLNNEFPEIQLNIHTEKTDQFFGDLEQMQLLFYHLLSNAVRFRKDKTKVFVSISARSVQLNQFKNIEGKYKYVDHTIIRVTDKGIGFNAEYKSQVFELFKKLHKESGPGVGLSICKKITENHQGTIFIDSKIDEGTTVTIHLPLQLHSSADSSDRIKLKTQETRTDT